MNAVPRELDRDIAGATVAHAVLVSSLAGLTDVDVTQPSLLPGWTVGHVLTHIARNADSHVRMLHAANRGEIGAQYPGGGIQRTGDIEAGAVRPATEQVADVAVAIQRAKRDVLAHGVADRGRCG
ncbi:MAG: maleylpyruvate isomerase N-terminal domain-containing protein, partial [Actinomycetota bacterium]